MVNNSSVIKFQLVMYQHRLTKKWAQVGTDHFMMVTVVMLKDIEDNAKTII